MDFTMVSHLSNYWLKLLVLTKSYKKRLLLILVIITSTFAYFRPQQFVDLWLTRDQQGHILFQLGLYQQASNTFKNTQWQAYSSYGAEQFKNAATLYGQFADIDNQLAKANALAHGREYLQARNLYQNILRIAPQNESAATNLSIVQEIIDEINLLSASQQAEQGESIKELGDEPQTADGAERQEIKKPEKVETLTAEQLLLDPNLNEMWLRQVQKNPADFLSQKFYMQKERKDKSIINDSEPEVSQK